MRPAHALVLLALIASGCSGVDVAERWDTDPPLRLAVLPFTPPGGGSTDDAVLDQIDFLRRELVAAMSEHPVALCQVDRVDETLARAEITDVDELVQSAPEELADTLGVDALVYGEITHLRNISPLIGHYRSIGAVIRCVARDGEQLWEIDHTERKSGGPLVDLGSQVVVSLLEQLENSSNLAFVRLAESWAARAVAKLPTPTGVDAGALREAQAAPRLRGFTIKASREGTLVAGDLLQLDVTGEQGLQVSVHRGRDAWFVLAEVEPGTYRGTYVVQPGTSVEVDKMVAVGRNRFGKTRRVSLDAKLAIDAGAPPAPTALTVQLADEGLTLSWTGTVGEGETFVVYRARAEAPGAWDEVARTREPRALDSKADAKAAARYAVVAMRGDRSSHPALVVFRP